MSLESNANQWKKVISDRDTNPAFKKVIEEFLLYNDIDFKKFIENSRANEIAKDFGSGGLTGWRNMQKISLNKEPDIECTPTFESHYSENTFNRSENIPDWFYIAYPDVAKWFHSNIQKFDEVIERNSDKWIDSNNKATNAFLKYLINVFNKDNHILECTTNLSNEEILKKISKRIPLESKSDTRTLQNLLNRNDLNTEFFTQENINKKSGCYIATVCYGSENAPEVILLKSYRDNTLSKKLIGRIFIKVYYFLSPKASLVLARTPFINNAIRKYILSKIVNYLNLKK